MAVLALSAAVAIAAAGTTASGSAPGGLRTSLRSAELGSGATASGGDTLLILGGSATGSRTTASVDPATGELVVRDPTGTNPPGDPCTPPPGTTVTEFRCPAGLVDAIIGNLGGGDDRFTAAANLKVFIGALVGSQSRPLRGGPGPDRLSGGAVGDGLLGGPGPDRLSGRGGSDFLNGGAGADRLLGGAVLDALFGGGGNDRLNGGAGRDLCNGGGGRDVGRGCFDSRRIP